MIGGQLFYCNHSAGLFSQVHPLLTWKGGCLLRAVTWNLISSEAPASPPISMYVLKKDKLAVFFFFSFFFSLLRREMAVNKVISEDCRDQVSSLPSTSISL
jgi:hypothetical protein